MKGFCAVLGFRIEKETGCKTSGNHSLCQRCRDLAQGKGARGGQEEGSGRSSWEIPQVEGAARTKRRRRCKCGRTFSPKCNRQRLCPICGEKNGVLKNRERQARFYKNHKNNLRLTV